MKQPEFTKGKWYWDGDVCNYDPTEEAPWLMGENNRRILTGEINCYNPVDAKIIVQSPVMYQFLTELIDGFEDKTKLTIWERNLSRRAKEIIKSTE